MLKYFFDLWNNTYVKNIFIFLRLNYGFITLYLILIKITKIIIAIFIIIFQQWLKILSKLERKEENKERRNGWELLILMSLIINCRNQEMIN
jgi:hypothetical protein